MTYSFYDDDVFHGAYYGSVYGYVDVCEISDAMKDNVRRVLAWYESVINVDFVEVAETSTNIGYIRFMLCPAANYGMAFYPEGTDTFSMSGDVMWNPTYDRLGDGNGFQHPAGMWGYQTIVHEIGHAVGLKHPFEGASVLPAAEDIHFNTTMSYTGTWIELAQSPATPMAYDLLTLQHMYGARPKNSGDDVYRLTGRGTSQYTLTGATWQPSQYEVKQTIWDSGGRDTIDASGLPYDPSGYRLDLRGGGRLVSLAYHPQGDGYQGGCSLAFPFQPEAFVNSSSSDQIIANGSVNTFGGYAAGRFVGDDTLSGASAVDTLDLSAYSRRAVTATAIGSDLLLQLGPWGSVRVIGYYAGNTPNIVYVPSGALAGTVRSGGRPLSGATVSVGGISTSTDSYGRYSITDIAVGDNLATYDMSGYLTQTVVVSIGVDSETRVDADLVEIKYSLSYAASPGGSIEGSSTQLVISGASGTAVTAVPAEHYHFVSWSDGVTTAARTDSNVTTDKTLTASFAIDTRAITASAGSGGSISPRGISAVTYGADSATYTITPASGYVIGDVKVDGISQGPISRFRFTSVTAPHAISATFKRVTKLSMTSDRTTSTRGHTIAFSGTISPNVANNTHVTVWMRKSTTSKWTLMSTRHTYSSHRWSYSLSTRTRKHGTYYVQVRYAGSSTRTTATSSSRKIVIK